jgi:hypothetical protein
MIIISGILSNKSILEDKKIKKGFPVIIAEVDGLAVGFGMVVQIQRSL